MHRIENTTDNLKLLLSDDHGEQYYNAFTSILNGAFGKSYEELNVINETINTLIDDDYKNKLIKNIKKDSDELKQRVTRLETDNEKLIQDNINKENTIAQLKNEITILKDDKNKFNALVKLHECNALVNKEFRKKYMEYFKKGRGDYVPNIGDYIGEPPTENDSDYDFWNSFISRYPQSNDPNFRNIYQQISRDRADNGAHVSVRNLTKSEYDELIQFVYPNEYKTNKQLYDDYRDWLFTFPA